ncbi:hypothetical protein HMPREF0731_0236 [Pseudoroseomonas cervicalis ATCC 49957]|uniref:Uncharacterized protein n=1 Tax=Pseudoroseomonas cervicalis ATCC 49957 TaxID=525371 RepID=D5RGM7_9PROT|nr:hypothetical protein HMPREF0731_0236 [Pseudoroseomonas cervicalis ATCC 49957]
MHSRLNPLYSRMIHASVCASQSRAAKRPVRRQDATRPAQGMQPGRPRGEGCMAERRARR